MHANRNVRSTIFVWLGVATLLGAGVGLSGFGQKDVADLSATAPMLWIAASALLVVVATAVGTSWMNSIDELAQRAHYVAWYWGGSMALALLIFLFLAGPALASVIDFDAILTPLEAIYGRAVGFLAGVVVSLVALTAGYLLWWVVYWVRKQ